MPETAVIIVNWNGRHLLSDCLNSLKKQTYRNFTTYVVDNHSSDDSVEFIKNEFPEARVIQLKKNFGFARGNNEGIKEAFRKENICFIATLNNDTVVDKNWLMYLVKEAKKNKEAASFSSKTLCLSKNDTINSCGMLIYQDGHAKSRGFHEKLSQYIEKEEIFGPSAVAALYKKRALKKVGLFDNLFFMYQEEVDLAWRLRFAGYKSVYVPKAIVYHRVSFTSKPFSPLKAYYSERNRIWLVFKNFTASMIFMSIFYTIKRYTCLLTGLKQKKGPMAEFTQKGSLISLFFIFIKAWTVGLIGLPLFINKRIKIQKLRKASGIGQKEINEWFKKFGTKAEGFIIIK